MNTKENGNGESFAALFERGGAPNVRQRRLSVGDEVDAIVVKVGTDAIFLDLDGKREAFVDRESMVDADGKPLPLEIGNALHARVAEVGGRTGGVRLEPVSIRRFSRDEDDEGGEEVELVGETAGPRLTAGAHVKGEIVRVESYGVFVQIEGTTGRQGRGLLPAVETGLRKGSDLRKELPVGKQIEVKILSIEDDGKMRLSIRALQADEERKSFKKFSGENKPTDRGLAGLGTLADAFAKRGQMKRR